ncbi:hypothetical protein HYW76_01455 [Candidatus Pacearchaeota archaeon]|nr:hypothetical protein [Candidatus Pacearchaeota archaeon]
MENKCIKDVDEKTWKDFKAIAIKNRIKMSILLKIMVNEFERNSKNLWGKILSRKKSLTNKEAEDIENIVRKIRKERGFRDEPGF